MEKEKQKFNLISISWNLDTLVLNKDLGILLISHSNGIQEQKCWKKVEIMCEENMPCQRATQGHSSLQIQRTVQIYSDKVANRKSLSINVWRIKFNKGL
jgi:hypothetical protein